MKIGDILEWLAGAGLVTTAILYTHHTKAWAAVLVGSLFLAYQAQCYAAIRVPPLRLTRLRKLHFPRRKKAGTSK